MADFLRIPLEGGGEWTRLDRLDDGSVMCCICFSYRQLEELVLDPIDNKRWDVCWECKDEAGV